MFQYAGDGTYISGDFQESLRNICIERKGERVKQEDILYVLGIADDLGAKSRLSRALAAIFPSCEKKRVMCEHKQIYPFLKTHFQLLSNMNNVLY